MQKVGMMNDLASYPGPRGFPLLGHTIPLLRDPLAFLLSLPAYGDLVKVRLGPLAVLMVCDPELTHQVMVEDKTFDKGGPMYERFREVIGDDLTGLDLTRRIIDETLRLYPPGWITTRTVTTDTRLGDHHIPAGTTLAVSPYLIHHLPDLHPEPERFNPDRWITRPPTRTSLVSFSDGARRCIGDNFAMTEATLGLATIASRWHIHTTSDAPHRPSTAVTLNPRGLQLRVTTRNPGGTPPPR
jgi:Cytochrome P450